MRPIGAFHVRAPYHLIQGIRLVHALMESSYRVHVPSEHADKFSRLREVFGIDFAIGADATPELPSVTISHAEPLTLIGSVQRPLIFARAIPERCRQLWSADRCVRFSFVGLITDKRRAVLEEWGRRSAPPRSWTMNSLVRGIVQRARWSDAAVRIRSTEVAIWSSERGRQFPGKSWDEEYQAQLGRSQFVLCPNGDFVWSYRFFEAALCGAMPIIEQYCPLYEGFRYRTMEDPAAACDWRLEDAEHNFALCRSRLTVSRDELDAEIASLLSPT
jgi:hypothetical protein